LDGNARNVLNREARWGDGWLPIGVTPEDIKRSRAILSELAEVAERDPDSISITIHCQPPDRDMIDQFEEAGADRVLLRIGAPDQARALAQAEEFANAVLR
jgi:alkanesulfonate monooxygenase SsuD/methylene tetrahydromethanopterin reductase-like flavin-dependent oxidoreductase (luciferase family)